MLIQINKEGYKLAGILFIIGVLSAKIGKWLARLFMLAAAFTLYFFRDPDREIPQEANAIVSPADGRVAAVDTVENVPFLNGAAKRVSIFLSIFNVHVNRSPIKGRVVYRQYNPGLFLPAYKPKASLDNEQNSLGIEGEDGCRVLVRQIAGIIARRIVCFKAPGMRVERGERFGMIRFGSRTDLYMPLDAEVCVEVGQCVKGGSTIVARRTNKA